MKQWVALTLLIPQEFLEPVSNFLMEQGATGLEEEMREDSKEIVLKSYFPRDGREKKAIGEPSSVYEISHHPFFKEGFLPDVDCRHTGTGLG